MVRFSRFEAHGSTSKIANGLYCFGSLTNGGNADSVLILDNSSSQELGSISNPSNWNSITIDKRNYEKWEPTSDEKQPYLTLKPCEHHKVDGWVMCQNNRGDKYFPPGKAHKGSRSDKSYFGQNVIFEKEVHNGAKILILGQESELSNYYGGKMRVEYVSSFEMTEQVDSTGLYSYQIKYYVSGRYRIDTPGEYSFTRGPFVSTLRESSFIHYDPVIDDLPVSLDLSLKPADSEQYNLALDRSFQDAYAQIRLMTDMNNLDNIRQTVDMLRNPVKALSDIFSTWFSLDPSTMGSKWLQYRYVICTTSSDIAELPYITKNVMDTYQTHIRRGKSQQTYITEEGNEAVVGSCVYATTGRDPTGHFQRLLNAYGISPSLKNFWDMVPFSFVIDWICGSQAAIQRIDNNFSMKLDEYALLGVCTTRRVTQHYENPLYEVDVTRFDRRVSQSCPVEISTINMLDEVFSSIPYARSTTWAKRWLDLMALGSN